MPPPAPAAPQGGTALLLRGLDKITGRPTNIAAPIGKPVQFATLTITARFCYSTPPSETPETAAFVQIDDHRPDQPARRVFSGWMYASSPGLNGVEHPLYDVWVISCNNAPGPGGGGQHLDRAGQGAAPDSSDKEGFRRCPRAPASSAALLRPSQSRPSLALVVCTSLARSLLSRKCSR